MIIKQTLVFAATCLAASAILAAPKEPSVAEKLMRESAKGSKVGGLLRKPSVGRFVFLSAQDKLSEAKVREIMRGFSDQFKADIEYAKCAGFALDTAAETMKKDKVTIGVFLVDDAKLPMSLVAMEQQWMAVNLAHLTDGKVAEDVLANRLDRELSRSFKALFAGVDTRKDTMAAKCGADLDKIKFDPIDGQALFNIIHGLPSYGFIPSKITTYKKACMEGWAPAPTNDAQRAIWKDVHKLPEKPIKIEFDPKKDK